MYPPGGELPYRKGNHLPGLSASQETGRSVSAVCKVQSLSRVQDPLYTHALNVPETLRSARRRNVPATDCQKMRMQDTPCHWRLTGFDRWQVKALPRLPYLTLPEVERWLQLSGGFAGNDVQVAMWT